MAEHTGIEWCDHTFNPWLGCTKVSPACDHCYAERWGARFGIQWGNHPRRLTNAGNWRQPLVWNRAARAAGVRRRVFCASLADVFDNQVDPAWRWRLWDLMGECRDLIWLLLTKRPQNIPGMLPGPLLPFFDHVWLGITAENQEEYDRRWPNLAAIPAARHFISYEPALGPLLILGQPRPDWLICGGESGPGARPMHPDWARSLRDQCQAAGVPFFFKQWGEWIDADEWLDQLVGKPLEFDAAGNLVDWRPPRPLNYSDAAILAEMCGRKGLAEHQSDGSTLIRVGKRAAGRLLDGREWSEFPA